MPPQPLVKEHTATEALLHKTLEAGAAYDATLRGERAESPSRRRSSVKRPSVSTPLKSAGEAFSGS